MLSRSITLPPASTFHRAKINELTVLQARRDIQTWINTSFATEGRRSRNNKSNIIKKIVKETAVLEEKLAKTTAALQSTSEAYNKGKLRRADRINVAQVVGGVRRRRAHWALQKEWTLAGTISLACNMVGMMGKVGYVLNMTNRAMDAVAIVALACLAHLRGSTLAFNLSLRSQVRLPHFVMCMRALDCTPIPIKFGMLRGNLAKVARYWFQETAGSKTQRPTWSMLTADEFLKRGGKFPQFGVVELMAQSCALVWPEAVSGSGTCVNIRRELTMPVAYVARTNSSCHLRAFNLADPSLCVSALLDLTVAVRIVMIGIGSDMAASVVRMKMFVGTMVRACNERSTFGRAALYTGDCVGHIVHREAEHCAPKDCVERPWGVLLFWIISKVQGSPRSQSDPSWNPKFSL